MWERSVSLWVQACQNTMQFDLSLSLRLTRRSTVLIVLAVVIDSFFFLNSILEYTTRYALDMLESTGSAPKCFKRMMHIRASKFYSKTLSAVMGFALFVFCAYFILVSQADCRFPFFNVLLTFGGDVR